MNLIRLLIIALLAWLAYRFIKRLINPEPSQSVQGKGEAPAVDTMVRCEECGLHVPDAEAVHDGGHTYCSTRHRDQHRARHGN